MNEKPTALLAFGLDNDFSFRKMLDINIFSPEKMLIQEVPQGLSSLKYFYENAPYFYIVAAGSLLGVLLHHQ